MTKESRWIMVPFPASFDHHPIPADLDIALPADVTRVLDTSVDGLAPLRSRKRGPK